MKVVAIQILPVTLKGEHAEGQAEGADHNTDLYSVYHRLEDGSAQWVCDRPTERDAAEFARQLCVQHGVPLEPYPWQRALIGV